MDQDLVVFKKLVDRYDCSSKLLEKYKNKDGKPKVYLYVKGAVGSAEHNFKIMVGKAIGMCDDEILFCKGILFVRYPSKHVLGGYKDKLVDIADGSTRTAVVFGQWKKIFIEAD